MSRKKMTVKDFLDSKGKRQLSVLFVHNVQEALAAEKAGIDMIIAAYDIPKHGIHATLNDVIKMREAAPNCFFQSAVPHLTFASEYELIKGSYKLLDLGIDCIYCANSTQWIKAMRRENIPVISHVGLIPSKASWLGGFRAIGKTAEEAISVLRHTLELEEVGVIGVELEVVPTKVAAEITKRTKMITMSMGSGSDCDAQYLFANDVLGYTQDHIPRHSRIYRQFNKEYERLQNERISAFKEFHIDTINKKFNDPKITVSIEDEEYEKFIKLIEKL